MIKNLEKKLNIKFKNSNLLEQALVHRSYLNEHSDFKFGHNERLEFLGDAVLELIVTEYLFQNYSNPEGDLTNWRAALVNSKMLSSIARTLDISSNIMLSKGESKDEGRGRDYILANAFEAIVGAIYLDKGFESAKKFVIDKVIINLPDILKKKLYQDPKSEFQEKAQEKIGETPVYKVIEEKGPDHDKHFTIAVFVGNEEIARGQGASKQEAEEDAAKNGLEIKHWI